MPGLEPGIHVLLSGKARKTWMAGTSPAMTSGAGSVASCLKLSDLRALKKTHLTSFPTYIYLGLPSSKRGAFCRRSLDVGEGWRLRAGLVTPHSGGPG
jgi:hypothetical protein